MVVLIFGVTNVGKTVTGEKLAKLLGYPFYDLDDEIRKTFRMTLEEFIKKNPWPNERFIIKGKVLKNTIENNGENMVIAVSPIYYARNFNYLLKRDNVIAVELQDTKENIFDRLVFSDENDRIYKDDEYKEAHREHYLKEIREDIQYAKRTFRQIQWKYFMDNKSPEQVAKEIAEMLPEKIREKHNADHGMLCQELKTGGNWKS